MNILTFIVDFHKMNERVLRFICIMHDSLILQKSCHIVHTSVHESPSAAA